MKKIIYGIFLFYITVQSYAINIQQITVTPISDSSSINIHTLVSDGYYFEFYNYNYEIDNNIITLSICYHPYLSAIGTFKENDFVIPNLNLDINNFTLIVNVYKRKFINGAFTCSTPFDDTETIQFSTPLQNAVSLSNSDFDSFNNKFVMYPNPTKGIVYFSETDKINKVTVYNELGKQIKIVSDFSANQMDLTTLENGIYFLKLYTDFGEMNKKIVVIK